MRHVKFSGPGVTTSAVGYGCASLMARVTRRESVRLLETAFTAGITHFDTARLYGYGEAEGALGDFMAGRRHAVTVTTKFGIVPPRRSPALRAAVSLARGVVAVAPSLRPLVRRQAARLASGGRFGVQDARASLETSLRELRTDYVDFFMLHECAAADATAPELHEFLERCIQAGTIRHIGIAADRGTAMTVIREQPNRGLIAQYPWEPSVGINTRRGPARPVFVHSVLGTRLRKLVDRLAADSTLRQRWSGELDEDCANPSVLSGLLLEHARRDSEPGVVIFSSVNEANIKANARGVDEGRFSEQQLHCFTRLLADVTDTGHVRMER